MADRDVPQWILDLPPYERLNAVGLTVVTVSRDGETFDEVRDEKNWCG